MSQEDVNDFLMSGGVTSFPFENVGDEVEGTIVQSQLRKQTDFETGEPQTWPDGNPKMQIVMDLETALRDPEKSYDDGVRRLFIKGNALRATREAVRAGGGQLLNGGWFKLRHSALGTPPKKGLHAPKLFEAQYKAPAASGISADDIA